MERSRVREVHYITPLANIASILERGILSHNRVSAIDHFSIADEDVQDRRRGKRVPNGGLLHDYVNTYFDARNPMMYRRRNSRDRLCVLRISPDVLDIPGAIISDGNAASSATRFAPAANLSFLDEARVYARYWNAEDGWEYLEAKRQRCAEVLVPYVIPAAYIYGCYVRSKQAAEIGNEFASELEVVVNSDVFFA